MSRSDAKTDRASAHVRDAWRRVVPAFAAACILTAASSPSEAGTLPFPSPPNSAQQAIDDLPKRRLEVARFAACGNEIEFLKKVNNIVEDPGAPLPGIIGKMLWLILHPEPAGGGAADPVPGPREPRLRDDPEDAPIVRIQGGPRGPAEEACIATVTYGAGDPIFAAAKTANGDMAKAFPACTRVIDLIDEQNHQIRYRITHACMRQQINRTLKQVKVKGQLGTEKLPCVRLSFVPPEASVTMGTGEWDATLKALIRIIYLHEHNKSRAILNDSPNLTGSNISEERKSTVQYIKEHLLTADGPPGLTSYGLLQCGNQEKSTGNAQERAAERAWLDDTLPAVADLWDWWALRIALFIVLAALVALLALLSALGGVVGGIIAAIATVAAVAGTAALLMRIPETENHMLLIESARYLNNQLIIADLEQSGDLDQAAQYAEDNREVRDRLLTMFQKVLKSDFDEYNSRPYQNYSINAILNVAQFATDDSLRTGAQAVLDYATAKFAVGSSMSRRLVPFRRLMEHIRKREPTPILDPVSGGDHLIPYMMFYTGQTQHIFNAVGDGLFDQMVPAASSTIQRNYKPEDSANLVGLTVPPMAVLDAAIVKATPIEQRIRHAGVEIYSSGDGWLVTAGGIQSPPANLSFVQFAVKLPILQIGRNTDRGAAWPTTLMLSAGLGLVLPKDFLRIDGVKITHTPDTPLDEEDFDTYDGNMCVGLGFACGFNLKIPDHMVGCLQALISDGRWRFFDSRQCAPYNQSTEHDVFVAIFREDCPHARPGPSKCDNFGMFEVISMSDPSFGNMPEHSRFGEFVRRVEERNAKRLTGAVVQRGGVFIPDNIGGPTATTTPDFSAAATYQTAKDRSPGVGHSIDFAAVLFDGDDASADNRIHAIDGQERRHTEWRLADGDLIRADSNGRVEIGRRTESDPPPLVLDFTEKDHPVRR
jgi:hypothetical protein